MAINTRLLALFLLTFWVAAHGYELETHSAITSAATTASNLEKDPELLKDLGIESTQKFPDGRFDTRTLSDLLQQGSRWEDDIPRPANHFYDPLNPVLRKVPGFSNSPEWAVDGEGDTSTTKFSFRAARQYMFLALTDRVTSFREKQFGLMFRSLGQVIHNIQDMAQPQHTRFDLHCRLELCRLIGQHAPSHYELFTDSDGLSTLTSKLSGYAPVYSVSDTQSFNSPKSFWHTQDGRGLADYSNRGFVSAGTNFDKPGLYTSPAFNAANAEEKDLSALCESEALQGRPCLNPNPAGKITFYGTEVTDALRPSSSALNPRTSSQSAFDPDLIKAGRTPVFNLNRFNFYAAHDLLMPRAVGYSAGLINYFFRGRLDLRKDAQDSSKFRIVNLGPETMSGKFALYYDAKDGNRYPVQVVADPSNPNMVDPNEPNVWRLVVAAANPEVVDSNLSFPIAFIPPANDNSPTAAKTRNEYTLVFSGNMGEERADPQNGVIGAVAAKVVKPEYNGVLYVRVTSSERGTTTLRVDKKGTRFVEAEEFDPFFAIQIRQDERPNYTMKQVEFKTDSFGEPVHRTIALAAGSFGDFSLPRSYAFDGPTGFRTINEAGVSWLAKSPDPRIGNFVIGTVPFQKQISELQYTRTFQQDGQTQTATGSIPLPQPSFPDFDLVDIHDRFFVAADGLTYLYRLAGLDGIAGTGTPLITARFLNYRFSLSATPTVSTEVGAPWDSNTLSTTTQNLNELLGTFTTTPTAGRCPGQLPPQTTIIENRHFLKESGGRSTNNRRRAIEYQNGQFLTFDSISRGLGIQRDESFGGGVTIFDCPDPWDFSDLRADFTHTSDLAIEDKLPGGSVFAGVFRAPDFNRTIRSLYEGPRSGNPGQTVQEKGLVDTFSGFTVARALSINPRDAVLRVMAFSSERVVFRDNEVTGQRFTAESSPLGEVFFATEDKSLLFHEPKEGGMPVIQLPPDVIRILSAIWL